MGNIHTVIQVAPVVHIEGAAILVKESSREHVKWLYGQMKERDYTTLQENPVTFFINNPNVGKSSFTSPVKLLYLVIESGGKWGYSDDLFSILKKLAPFLEEAVFYISDEYEGYVEEWAITGDTCRRKIMRGSGSDAFSCIEETYGHDKNVLFGLYYQQGADYFSAAKGWLSVPSLYTELANDARACLDKALAIRPDHIATLQLTGDMLAQNNRHEEAGSFFEKALDILKQQTRFERWGNQKELLSVEDDWDSEKTNTLKFLMHRLSDTAMSLGKYEQAIGYLKEWSCITPTWNDQTPFFLMAYCLNQLGKHDETIALYNQVIRQSSDRKLISNAFYNRACCFVLKDKLKEGFHDLYAAICMDEQYREMARTDTDFTSVLQRGEFAGILNSRAGQMPE